jgi:DNA-directed RNA polymerase subunit RPC12/RpoP
VVCHYEGCTTELTGRQRKWCSEHAGTGQRASWLLSVYNLSLSEYNAILAHQGGVCGLCQQKFKEGKTPHVDHDHHTGHVRGVVCAYCNTRLIVRLRSWQLAQKLADYLRDPPAIRALGAPVVAPGRPKKKRKRR